jgi:hypothetical protein
MQRIDLEPSSSHRGADSVLYLADRPSKRLLAWIDTDVVGNVPGITKLAHELTDEGWNVLHIRAAADAGADAIAGAIAAATSRGDASLGPPHVVVIAEAASVTAACAAVRNSHRRSEGVAIAGLVTVDATPDSTARDWSSLAEITGLATLIATRRSSGAARHSGLVYHRHLQSLDRNTHFMVLTDDGRSVAERLADPGDAFGREVRWLLEPVNSRTDHLV